MAKRKQSPWQGDLFEAVALEYTVPLDALAGELLQHLQDALPPGVPMAVTEVVSVVRDPHGALVGHVRVFDGQLHTVRVRGNRHTFREYSWPDLKVPFGWDEEIKAWRRYPKDAEQTSPDAALTPGERLMADGLVDATWVRLGGDLRDPDAPAVPRSLAAPLFGKVLGSGELRLYLNLPSAADLLFVRHVEEVSGLKAVWDAKEMLHPFAHRGHHAEDLATDEGWESLAASLEHTTPDYVMLYAARATLAGKLSVSNGRALLEAASVPEPENRDAGISRLPVYPTGQVNPVVSDAWAVIHAAEQGLLKPGGLACGYQIPPCLTDAGRVRFGLPPKRQPKAA